MSPSATPSTQSAAASPATNAVQARYQSQPSAISATPATQNEGGCYQMPRLPHETKVDVAKAATQSATASPAINTVHPRHQSQPSAISATPAAQNEGGYHQVPPLPCKTKCHACHGKCRGVTGDRCSPSAPPKPAQCHKWHTGHAKRRWMSPSATPAT